MKDIINVAFGVVLGHALWGCLPFLILLALIGGLILLAVGIHYWWLILIVLLIVVFLNMGTKGHQRRHTAGFYATQVTGYRPRAYRAPSTWSLKVIDPNRGSYRVPVSQAGTWIGRSRDCQIRLPDPTVSRHHCWIGPRNGYLHVQDNQSRYGLVINGRRTGKAYLRPGDEIQVGRTRLQVRRN